MNDNTNKNQPELKIVSMNISSNRDKEETYSIEIQTSAHTIVYPRVNIKFGANQAIVFPVEYQVMDDKNNILFNYALNLDKPNQETQQKE